MQQAGGHREIWILSWPVMAAQVLVNAVGLVDIAMVGRLGPDSVAAVGYATQFFNLAQAALFAETAAAVAAQVAGWFPDIEPAALARMIDGYRACGVWARAPALPCIAEPVGERSSTRACHNSARSLTRRRVVRRMRPPCAPSPWATGARLPGGPPSAPGAPRTGDGA